MESKKIGILTFSYSSNPGSVLQAYALQKIISEIDGYEASIINYQKVMHKPVLGRTVFFGPIKNWSVHQIASWILRMIVHPLRMSRYERFFEQYYSDSNYLSEVFSREKLTALEGRYDIFVVGSDQVWNFDSPTVDYTYFLDFVKNSSKKISYAASFGQCGVPEEKREIAAKLISDFSSISVRESEGVETVAELTGRSAEWVLDPSLLLDKSQYESMAVSPSKKKYVFLYLREPSSKLETFAKRLAKHYELDLVKVRNHWLYNKIGKPQRGLGPLEWLGYMQNAEYVITNSFHGVCFSLAFEKEFYVDLLNGERSFTNTRIESLINQFELNSRLIDSVQDIAVLEKINYERINAIKSKRQADSVGYLKAALERSERNC